MAEDLLEKLLKESQSKGLGMVSTELTDEYFNLNKVGPVSTQPIDISGLGTVSNITNMPGLSDSYFKMQMYKPGETENKDMFMGMNPTEWSSAMKAGQLGLGGANLGLGILGYFQNKSLADKQKEVLGQQIESNRAEIDARKNYRSALEKF